MFIRKCLHCGVKTLQRCHPLCPECLLFLEPLHYAQRCSQCFYLIEGASYLQRPSHLRCRNCSCRAIVFDDVSAVWEYRDAVRSLIHAYKINKQWYLAESLSAYLYMQIQRMGWEDPDIITWVPQTYLKSLGRIYNPSELLARNLAHFYNAKALELTKKYGGDIPQSSRERSDRFEKRTSYETRKIKIEKGKTILLIDDIITTGQTLYDVGNLILELEPKKIYGLGLARGDYN